MIEEASRKHFIYPYKEQSGYSTIDSTKRAITFFGYAPKVIQTDNGGEFTNFKKTDRVHIFDHFCNKYGIVHKPIRLSITARLSEATETIKSVFTTFLNSTLLMTLQFR